MCRILFSRPSLTKFSFQTVNQLNASDLSLLGKIRQPNVGKKRVQVNFLGDLATVIKTKDNAI